MPSFHRTIGLSGLAVLLTLGDTCRAQDAGPDGKPGLLRMEVKSVWKSPDPRVNVVFLKDVRSQRLLPIWIGPFEADAIQMRLGGESFPRPLTHDLLKSLIDATGARVQYVLVDALRPIGGRDSGTYFAKISLALKGGGAVEVDSRTSDAIALSVRTGTPVYVAAGIVEGNGVADEREVERELMGEGTGKKSPGKAEKKERKPGNAYY